MAPAEPLQAALQVAAALECCGVRYLVGGSVASSVTGEPRSTMDVDLVVALTQENVAPFLANLGDGFYADEETLRNAIRTRSSVNQGTRPGTAEVAVSLVRHRFNTVDPTRLRTGLADDGAIVSR